MCGAGHSSDCVSKCKNSEINKVENVTNKLTD